MQSRGDVAMRAQDHPALSTEAIRHVEAIGRSLARNWDATQEKAHFRCRSFLVRAFSEESASVALFAVHRLGPAAVRTTGFSYAAALIDLDGGEHTARVVRDRAGETAVELRVWRPKVE
jgi:hypothetical protein